MAASDQKALPDNMFNIIKSSPHALGPRLGQLVLPGKKPIDTPHYLGITSRGAIPHITQDNFRRHTAINGVYVALEDFIERGPKETPPLYGFRPSDNGDASRLRRFIALPDETLLVLGARRTPPITAPAATPNTYETISVCTSVGFRALPAIEYADAAERLKPDVVVGLGDVPYGRALGSKRVEKATDRCIQWLQDHVVARREEGDGFKPQLFASMLPVSCAKQQFYVDLLTDEMLAEVAGLGIFGLETLEDLPESLAERPRLAFTSPDSPQEVLRHICLGLDILTIPFIGAITDAGIALDFTFPVSDSPDSDSSDDSTPKSLGLDLWSSSHAVDLSPLTPGCECYACKHHHRAYVQHLLAAKEMLGWALLQIHNHHIMDLFFAGIRQSIAVGTFKEDRRSFERNYESRLPETSGLGPRVRGYQVKSEGPGEPKKNTTAFSLFDEAKEKVVDAGPPQVTIDADALQKQGFAEIQ